MQQGVDEAVLLDAIEPAVMHTGQQALHLFQQRDESLRLVAPGLAQQVGDQRVTDDAPRERVLIGGLLPARRGFQSSVMSWSSKIISDGTCANARATRGRPSRNFSRQRSSQR